MSSHFVIAVLSLSGSKSNLLSKDTYGVGKLGRVCHLVHCDVTARFDLPLTNEFPREGSGACSFMSRTRTAMSANFLGSGTVCTCL